MCLETSCLLDRKKMAVSEQNTAPACLFVGQVPKNMAEHELRAVLEEFGPIDNLTIIKDHATGLSKGKMRHFALAEKWMHPSL